MILKIKELIQNYTNHSNIHLTSRGNIAIYYAIYFCKSLNPKKTLLIPEEGGWLTYEKYAKKLGLNVKKIKTNNSVIDLEDLKNNLDDACAFIYTNPGGYFADQPMKEIYEICKCLVILDASGGIGTDMCNGNFADFIICSFGKWKPVNAEYGGFISSNKNFPDEKIVDEIDETKFELIYNKLLNLNERMTKLSNLRDKIKSDLKSYNILPGKGINIIITYNDNQEREKLIKYCADNKLEYTECPRYIRINKNAISIEVKRK